MSNPRTRSKAQAGAPASATMQPVGLVVPSTHSRSSSYDNVNAWREKQAAFPASSAGSPDEDCMPPNDDGSVSGSAVTPASSVILKRNSANGDVESVSNDGNKPKRIPTTPHRTSPIFQTHATELTVLVSFARILCQISYNSAQFRPLYVTDQQKCASSQQRWRPTRSQTRKGELN